MVLLSLAQGKTLLYLARKAIEGHFTGDKVSMPSEPVFLEKRGVFCTLKTSLDILRGCIGLPYPTTPLADALVDAAVSAATQDPRFKPLRQEEMENLRIEVTVLSPPEKLEGDHMDFPLKIKIGKHGLIIKTALASGLLLPQVAVENGEWTPIEFLEATCWKAGIPPQSWKDSGTEIYIFEGQVFSED